MLALLLVGQLLSAKKRLGWPTPGSLARWTDVHLIIGTAALLLLAVHGGLSLGAPMTTLLSGALYLLVVSGAVAAVDWLPREHLRRLHALLSWPFAVLLMSHVASVYYFS